MEFPPGLLLVLFAFDEFPLDALATDPRLGIPPAIEGTKEGFLGHGQTSSSSSTLVLSQPPQVQILLQGTLVLVRGLVGQRLNVWNGRVSLNSRPSDPTRRAHTSALCAIGRIALALAVTIASTEQRLGRPSQEERA